MFYFLIYNIFKFIHSLFSQFYKKNINELRQETKQNILVCLYLIQIYYWQEKEQDSPGISDFDSIRCISYPLSLSSTLFTLSILIHFLRSIKLNQETHQEYIYIFLNLPPKLYYASCPLLLMYNRYLTNYMDSEVGVELSENGIIYLSSGFDGPFFFQVIACRKLNERQYQLCLSDGKLYIGGKYKKCSIEVPIYSIVKVVCRFISKWCPIQILSLQIISNRLENLMGRPNTTLHDYFAECSNEPKQKNTSRAEDINNEDIRKVSIEELPRKKIKLTQQYALQSQQKTQQSKTVTTTIALNGNLVLPQYEKQQTLFQTNHICQLQTQKIKFKSDSQKQVEISQSQKADKNSHQNNISTQGQKKSIWLVEQSDQSEEVVLLRTQNKVNKLRQQQKKNGKVYVAEEHETFINKQLRNNYDTHNEYVSCLYERMLHWKILCRVICLRTFVSLKGKKISVFHLIDQKGDTIKGIYYYNCEKGKGKNSSGEILVEGKVYSFSGGDVCRTQDDTQYKSRKDLQRDLNQKQKESDNLEIKFDSGSQIVEHNHIFIYPFSVKKLSKFHDLLYHRDSVNLIGFIKKVQFISQSNENGAGKQKKKIKGIICSPVEVCQIQFTKTLAPGEKQPQSSFLYILNYFNVFQSENAIKLGGSNKSYFVKISNQDIDYEAGSYPEYQELKSISSQTKSLLGKPEERRYLNLSLIKYSKRMISQLKEIAQKVDCPLYSQLLISIADIKMKKQYKACSLCKRGTIEQEHNLYQCLKCKKIVDAQPTIILNVVFADATGSIETDVIGQKVSKLIQMQITQFLSLQSQDRQCTLQMSKFLQFVIKVKTERKSFKQLSHHLQQIEKQQLSQSINELRRRTVQEKLKLEEKWTFD